MKYNDGKLKLQAIKTKNKVLISSNISNDRYYSSYNNLNGLLFDGKEPKQTYRSDWYEIDELPIKIERKLPAKDINRRYELKKGYPVSSLTPSIVSYESWFDSDGDCKYEDVRGLYEYKCDKQDEGYEEVDFELNIVEEIDQEFTITKQQYSPKYNFLDEIQTHPLLLPLKPCKLSRKDSYDIIRNYIKQNIDLRYARITSDYDFCLTVSKNIELFEVEEYTVDVNAFHSRRKPKYEKRYRDTRQVKIFEVAPKPYNDYPVVTEFEGDSYEELLININTYLKELMVMINEPIKECECCKGRGVVCNVDN